MIREGVIYMASSFYISSKRKTMIQPIWKDYIVSLGTGDSAEYTIGYVGMGSLHAIYSGKAYRRPDKERIEVCINDVCADWLCNVLSSKWEELDRYEFPVEFVVQKISNTGQYTEVARVQFVNDWSYEQREAVDTRSIEILGMSCPINGHVDPRQWLLWTDVDPDTGVYASVKRADGTSTTISLNLNTPNDLLSYYKEDISVALGTAGAGTAVFIPNDWGNVKEVVIKGHEYTVVDTCSRYSLMYMNAYGGWDSFLIEGASSEEDTLVRHTMEKEGKRKGNYLNEIEKRRTFHTGWLTDEESQRMHHLLNSTQVFLHDLDTGRIVPVVLESTSTPYKTYKGEGRKLVNYTIEVLIAEKRWRR